jgi:predicted nucleotidyltransferase
MTLQTLDVSEERIRSFCVRWNITELALFGSVLRDDFGPNSDMDVLATFAPDS